MLLLTRTADPLSHTNGAAVVALLGAAVVALILYFSGMHFYRQFLQRYQARYNTPKAMGYFETLNAQLTNTRTDRREQFVRIWRRQADPDVERLRLLALTSSIASYVIWGAAVIFVSPFA